MGEGDEVAAQILNILDIIDSRDTTLQEFNKHQEVIKKWFYRRDKIKIFRIATLVLLWNKAHEKKGQHLKFDPLWIGPYQVSEIMDTFRLKELQGDDLSLLVNEQYLKHYFMTGPSLTPSD